MALPAKPAPACLREQWPTVWRFLLDRVDGQERAREHPTLLLFAEDRKWKLCLNDRVNKRSLWVSGGTVEAALDAAEAKLQAGTAEWRKHRQQAPVQS